MPWTIRSYNRARQCGELIRQLAASGMTSPGVLAVNGMEKESEIAAYDDIALPSNWKKIWLKKNIGCNAPLNEVFRLWPDEPFYGAIDDDEWVETPGWDRILENAAGPWGIANANDGWQSKERLQSLLCIGGDLVRCAGWHALPGLFHWHGESVWEELDSRCGLRHWCRDVKAEHRHWKNTGKDIDDTYRSQDVYKNNDGYLFQRWLENDAALLAHKITRARSDLSSREARIA